ncbi:MAG TPA: hypothetical protein VGQ24_06405 [Gemmatimonadales bacterium]|nr:hypothetical protein [Gemmatimonadales bacterium]
MFGVTKHGVLNGRLAGGLRAGQTAWRPCRGRHRNRSTTQNWGYIAGEVPDWRQLAHRRQEELTAAGLQMRLDHRAVRLDPG